MNRLTKASNVVLIGMPGSGKSTVGVILAKLLAYDFVDTDVLIQTSQGGRPLQDIVNKEGHLALRRVEEEVLTGLALKRHVIATGGSAAYSEPAMRHLRQDGVVVFLDCDLPTLERRIHNFDTRGLAKRPDQTFEDLFNERRPLYEKYADFAIVVARLTQEQVAEAIAARL